MKIEITATSYNLAKYENVLNKYSFNNQNRTIVISNLDELFQLKKEINREIIISESSEYQIKLEIYDDHRE